MQACVKKISPKWGVLKQNVFFLSKNMTDNAPILRQSDEELMLSFQKGEAVAFDVLLGRHKKPLYNFIYRILHNEQASEEAFQEVFLKVIRNKDDYRESAKFTTWLYTIARNHCIDELRKLKFRNHKPFESETDTEGQMHLSDEYRQNREQLELSTVKELEEHLESAIISLSADQREVFLLRHFQNMPFDEIAKISDLSINTVKSRMRYALQHIEKHLRSVGLLENGL